ncbi:hypothetical protein CC_1312 [Caulobacter vibrioides CB15]|uniref:Uncharacterized protein n=1 Tax=Caulobacter vibrioides (strain ATCC 19089 / CIP 103742 / CB 15) TaxID=190650 RepID=Q9A8P1_CAUVC|nr:hypothetical protein CC_1312 [Caulobacter vibrioides CB15]
MRAPVSRARLLVLTALSGRRRHERIEDEPRDAVVRPLGRHAGRWSAEFEAAQIPVVEVGAKIGGFRDTKKASAGPAEAFASSPSKRVSALLGGRVAVGQGVALDRCAAIGERSQFADLGGQLAAGAGGGQRAGLGCGADIARAAPSRTVVDERLARGRGLQLE